MRKPLIFAQNDRKPAAAAKKGIEKRKIMSYERFLQQHAGSSELSEVGWSIQTDIWQSSPRTEQPDKRESTGRSPIKSRRTSVKAFLQAPQPPAIAACAGQPTQTCARAAAFWPSPHNTSSRLARRPAIHARARPFSEATFNAALAMWSCSGWQSFGLRSHACAWTSALGFPGGSLLRRRYAITRSMTVLHFLSARIMAPSDSLNQ